MLAQMINSAAEELLRLQETAQDYQFAIGELAETADGQTLGRVMETLQGIDLMTQELQDVGKFLAVIALQVPRELETDEELALAAVKLHALRTRLGGTATEAVEAGDCDLFGDDEMFEAAPAAAGAG